MFDTTNPFGQSSSSPFASQSVFGQTNNASSNRFAPKPSFSRPTPFGSQTGGSIFGGTSTGVFGVAQSSSPFSSTTAFGASSSPAFGSSMPAFGSSSTPAFSSSSSSFGGPSVFGQKHAFGFGSTPTQSSPFGSTTQQSQPTFGGIFGSSTPFGSTQSAFGSSTPAFGAFDATSTPAFGATSTTAFGATSTSAFGATSNPVFGATSTPTFGSTGSPAFESIGTTFGVSNATVFGTGGTFGASSTPAFGTSNTPAFGASSTPSFSFGPSPIFGQSMPSFDISPFGTTAFGAQSSPFGNQSSASAFGSTSFGQSPFGSQHRGSRVAPYTPTTEADSESGTQPAAKLESISAMPVYKDKSHEKLRWEDYQLGDKDGPQLVAQPSGGIGFGVSTAPTSPFGSSHTSHQSKKKCASSLKKKDFVVDDDNESYNDKCDDESNGEYFPDQGDFANINEVDEVKVEVEVKADVAISGVENIQDENSRSLVDIDSDDVFSDVVNDDIQNAQLIQTQPVQTVVVSTVPVQTVVVSDIAHVSSSSVPVHNDAASAFGTFGACSNSTSTKVDFHGFFVLSQYVKYLENIYLREGEFWNTCIFKSVDFISCTLDIMGKALLIADAPWCSISPKKLCLMLQIMDDVIKAGFKLECVGTCTSRAKAFLSIEVNKTELEAEMKEVTGKIVSLQKELELQKNREAELQKQLEALSQFDSIGSSPWSYIVGKISDDGSNAEDKDKNPAENGLVKKRIHPVRGNLKANGVHDDHSVQKEDSYMRISGHRAGEAAIVYEHGADIEALMPKLQRSDYYTEP